MMQSNTTPQTYSSKNINGLKKHFLTVQSFVFPHVISDAGNEEEQNMAVISAKRGFQPTSKEQFDGGEPIFLLQNVSLLGFFRVEVGCKSIF